MKRCGLLLSLYDCLQAELHRRERIGGAPTILSAVFNPLKKTSSSTKKKKKKTSSDCMNDGRLLLAVNRGVFLTLEVCL